MSFEKDFHLLLLILVKVSDVENSVVEPNKHFSINKGWRKFNNSLIKSRTKQQIKEDPSPLFDKT